MEYLGTWLERVRAALDYGLFRIGDAVVTPWTLLVFAGAVVLLFWGSAILRRWLVRRVLVRTRLTLGAREAMGSIVRYAIVVVGFLVLLQTSGIDLTTLNVLAGAVGIGVGFGLQTVVSNFFSGLIILFERPIEVGDRIEVGDVLGDVVRISPRATTVVTNDNIAIIVPNSNFITQNVVNWSHGDPKVRFHVPVSVAYGSDVALVEKALLEAADEAPDLLKVPTPAVRLLEFGDSGVVLELRVWTTTLTKYRGILLDQVNRLVYAKLAKYGIQIPFPQRDLHVRDGRLDVTTAAD